jgi:AcrR family transcriptional regulator
MIGAESRLLDAVVEVVNRDGYPHLTVERLLVAAGVSRASFYQYFSNVDDCFWTAYRHHAKQLVSDVTAAVASSSHRELAAVDALVDAAISRPDIARLLMREGLAAGTVGLSERDSLVAGLERALTASRPRQSTIDLPLAVLIGATFRFLVMGLSDGSAVDGLREGLTEWVSAFTRRSSRPSWSTSFTPALSDRPPLPLRSRVQQAGSPRERILRATALTIRSKCYRAITVADIAAAAGVSRRSFYNEFPSKADAFMSAYEDAFQRALGVCTPAFFAPRTWPERVWRGALAMTIFLAREPLLTHLGIVECYAIPAFVLRVHDTQLAFTLFLEEGYRQRPEAHLLPRACSALVAATICEIAYRGSRHGSVFDIRRSHPLAVFIALTPFLGIDDAGEFVTGKLSGKGFDSLAAA